MSDHIFRILSIDEVGIGADLDCVGHDPETCDLKSWWEDAGPELLDLQPLDIALPVHAKPWREDDGPIIVLAEPAEPIVWDGTDEALEAIRAALASGIEVGIDEATYALVLWPSHAPDVQWTEGADELGRVVWGGRIQIVGDSFIILPPEVES